MSSWVAQRRCRRLLGVASIVVLAGGACGSSHNSARQSAETTTSARPRAVDWPAVDDALGRPAEVTGEVHRYGFPRTDLKVSLDGIALKAGFALGSYAAFVPAGEGVAVMGDLVLGEDEVSPVMAQLQAGGLDVSALHNHLLREQPKVMYMHYQGHGQDAVALARNLRSALEKSATPLGPAAPPSEAGLGFDPVVVDQILGHTGKTAGGLQKYAIGRAEHITMSGDGMDGTPLTPPLGVATVANFQPLGDGKAAITGDFALSGPEVAPVARTLRSHAIEVTAVHTHMTNDNPHLYYMHFFASGPATDLARGLRAALDQTNTAKE
jgi:hypothetical protein